MSLIKKRDVKDSLPERPRRNILIFQSKTTAGAEALPSGARGKFSYEVIPITRAKSAVQEAATGTAGSSKKPR
jgi:hypothetical protein